MSEEAGHDPTEPPATLRARAEARLEASRNELTEVPAEDLRRLVHELQIHQIELQLQNEELREAQVELAHSRDRYADLYDFAPIGYLTLDRKGAIREANLTAASMLGVERRSLAGMNFGKFVESDSQDHWYLYRRAVFAEDTKLGCELDLQIAQRGALAVSLEGIAFGSGECRCCRLALDDITERREAEIALHALNIDLAHSLDDRSDRLRSSIARIRLLSEAVSRLGEGVLITGDDVDWLEPDIVFVNEALCRITGYRAEELLGRTPRLLQGGATDPQTLARINAELAADRPCRAELSNYRKDGTRYEAEVFITPLREEGGPRKHFVSIYRDITQRKEAETTLREREEQLRAVMEAVVDAIIAIDSEGRIVAVNPATEDIFGYSRNELVGQAMSVLTPSLSHEEYADDSADHSEKGGARLRGFGMETIGQRKDGSFLSIDFAVSKAYGLGLHTGIIRDITGRKKLEQQVINAAEEERQRIAHDLHDDLGSLLTGVKLEAERLAGALTREESGREEEGRSIVRHVVEAITKTRQIARGLRPVGSDAEDLMGALRRLSTRTETTTALDCLFDCPAPVLVDDPVEANHLYRIAQEAVNNAVKHSRGMEITISLRNVEGTVVLRIDDDGTGFDVGGDRGEGLGLHIMHYRAHALGGSLRIERNSTGGTNLACIVPPGSG